MRPVLRVTRVAGAQLERLLVALRPSEGGSPFLQGAVEALLADALPAELVILNPPRGGVAPETIGPRIPDDMPPEESARLARF